MSADLCFRPAANIKPTLGNAHPVQSTFAAGNCKTFAKVSLRLSLIGFRLVDFFSKQIIVDPHGVPDPSSLAFFFYKSLVYFFRFLLENNLNSKKNYTKMQPLPLWKRLYDLFTQGSP